MVYNSVKTQCEIQCCMAEENESCDMSDMECCPPGMCNPTQCCYCCFICTLDNKKIEINIFQTNINTTYSEKQYALSDFVSDCWQPPEMV
jgi:hypothetical protein